MSKFIDLLMEIFGCDNDKDTDSATTTDSEYANVQDGHFFLKKSLITKGESVFYFALLAALKDDEIVMTKPRIEDVIGAKKKDIDPKKHLSNRGKIKSRHFDFVICNKGLKPLIVIELDDKSHNSEKAKRVDEFKNNVCQSVGLRMIRIPASDNYNTVQITGLIYN